MPQEMGTMAVNVPPGSIGKSIAAQSMRSPYKAYRSPYAPKYKTAANFHGITMGTAKKWGVMGAAYGGVAGLFALFFFAEVPRVSQDIMQKVPILGSYFVKEIPPEDNPF